MPETKRFLYDIAAAISSRRVPIASLPGVNVGLNALSIVMILSGIGLGLRRLKLLCSTFSVHPFLMLYLKNHFSCLAKVLIKPWR